MLVMRELEAAVNDKAKEGAEGMRIGDLPCRIENQYPF